LQEFSAHLLISEKQLTSLYKGRDRSDKITGFFLLNLHLPLIDYKLLLSCHHEVAFNLNEQGVHTMKAITLETNKIANLAFLVAPKAR
jgi:hypothetical protein